MCLKNFIHMDLYVNIKYIDQNDIIFHLTDQSSKCFHALDNWWHWLAAGLNTCQHRFTQFPPHMFGGGGGVFFNKSAYAKYFLAY